MANEKMVIVYDKIRKRERRFYESAWENKKSKGLDADFEFKSTEETKKVYGNQTLSTFQVVQKTGGCSTC